MPQLTILNGCVLQNHLLSCSLDGSIKVWKAMDTPGPGAVLDQAPIYCHPPPEHGTEVSLPPFSCMATLIWPALHVLKHSLLSPLIYFTSISCVPLVAFGLERRMRRKFALSVQPAKTHKDESAVMSGPVRQWQNGLVDLTI